MFFKIKCYNDTIPDPTAFCDNPSDKQNARFDGWIQVGEAIMNVAVEWTGES